MSLLGRIHGSLVFGRRVRVLGGVLADLVPHGARVLDVGCGDGSVAVEILRRRPDLELRGLDIETRPGARIPVEVFDGKRIPRDDASVDVVLFVDVLHHADEPRALLSEGARVARTGVVLKDHLREGFLAGPTLRLMDWVGNRPHGVRLPYNYLTRGEWREAFRRLGLRVAAWNEELGLYPRPASWIFERSLHFAARLVPGDSSPGASGDGIP